MHKRVLAGLLAAISCGGAQAADRAEDASRYSFSAPALAMATTPVVKTPALTGTMKAGGMTVRLENFMELRDGKVRAQVSFHNPSTAYPASVSLKTETRRANWRLTNRDGAQYRLVEVSQMGDAPNADGLTTVAAGATAYMTATFEADGASRGAQPFALVVPAHISWRTAIEQTERSGDFAINFRNVQRVAAEQRSVERVELASVRQAALPVAPAAPPAATTALAFEDDIAPMVADLPAAKPDGRMYLFAVGVETYDDAPAVPFADRSARLMTDLLRKRYGIPDDNITLVTGSDATGLKMLGRLNSLVQRLTPGDTVFFYYAGHGMAGRDGKAVYLVPKDAVPGAYETEMLSLDGLIRKFEQSPAARVVAFIDSCFSGRVGRDQSLFPGVGPLVPSPVRPTSLTGGSKVTLFMAGQANQFANDYPERGHRLFSYFLMRGLLEDGDVTAALNNYVAREVRRISSRRGAEYLQEPQFQGAANLPVDG